MKKVISLLGLTMVLSFGIALTSYAGNWEQKESGWYYKMDDQTYAESRWLQIENNWYRFGNDGTMLTGWQEVKKDWYYLDPATGIMRTGWFEDSDGNWYYLDDINGDMLKSKWTPDGYFVNKSGIYDASKGNKNTPKTIGPDGAVATKKSSAMLKGITFPDLPVFASTNLSTDTWGVEGSIKALLNLGAIISQEVTTTGSAGNVFYYDGTSITLSFDGGQTAKLKLVKAGDHYELYDYGTIERSMETPLLAMCSMISHTPQNVYNAIYTAAEYDQTIMRSEYYKTFGDSQIMYQVGDGFVKFLIKAN